MSASEYTELFRRQQEKVGPYRMFAVDVVGSRHMSPVVRKHFAAAFALFAEAFRAAYPAVAVTEYNTGEGPIGWDALMLAPHLQEGDAFAVSWRVLSDGPSDDAVMEMFERKMGNAMLPIRAGFASFGTCRYAEGGELLHGTMCFSLMTRDLKGDVLAPLEAGYDSRGSA